MKTAATKRRDRRRALQVGIAGLATLAAVLFTLGGNSLLVGRLSALVFDLYQNIKPRIEAAATIGGVPVVVVDIDERSINEIGQWPWARTEVAAIVDRLRELGAATVSFDVVFSEPDRTSVTAAAEMLSRAGGTVNLPANVMDNDHVLANSFAQGGVVAGFVLTNENEVTPPPPKAGWAFAGTDPSNYLLNYDGSLANIPMLNEAATGFGFFSFPPSRDGIVRTVPLVSRAHGQMYPALSIESLRLAFGASSFVIRGTGASGEADTGAPAMTALKVGDLEVPTGSVGDFRVYYSGMPSMVTIPAVDLLDPATATQYADAVAGRIALIGTSAVGLRDLVSTPIALSAPGVNVHAEIIDQILAQEFLTRPDWAPGAEAAVAILLTLILLVAVILLGPILGLGAALILVGAAIATSWFAFANGHLVLDPILPTISILSAYIVSTAVLLLLTDRERQFVRKAFQQYLAPAMVERLAEDPSALALGGETREITILFSDIRGFTSLSEKMDPQQITSLLNRFLTPMTDVLLKSDATIDKYIGDAIMCFWNAPLSTPEHQRRGCLAALAMLKELEDLNQREGMGLRIGLGLNTGECCVGNLGSEQRFSYSAIGDSVNVAARVEGLTKQYGLAILITENTTQHAAGLALLDVDLVRVVGRAKPIAVFTLLGDEAYSVTPEFSGLSTAHAAMIAHYRAGAFTEAADAVEAARKVAPSTLTKLYDVYAERIANLRANPPETWDGVFMALEK